MEWIVIGETEFVARLAESLGESGQSTTVFSEQSDPFDQLEWNVSSTKERTVIVDLDELDLDRILSAIIQLEETDVDARFIFVTSNPKCQKIISSLELGTTYDKHELSVQSFLETQR